MGNNIEMDTNIGAWSKNKEVKEMIAMVDLLEHWSQCVCEV